MSQETKMRINRALQFNYIGLMNLSFLNNLYKIFDGDLLSKKLFRLSQTKKKSFASARSDF